MFNETVLFSYKHVDVLFYFFFQIKYQDTCIPYEEELVLRPHDEVLLFHL